VQGGKSMSWKSLFRSMIILMALMWSSVSIAGEIVIGYTGPLSGPAAEYGQDIFNGIDMAVKEINSAGGIAVAGKKYTFKLEKLDDKVDPTQAVNNARRFSGNKAIAVFNGVFNTIVPLLKINQEKGNEFIVMAYTSTPKIEALGNKLMVNSTVAFTTYVELFADWALKKGWKKCAMVVTFGSYGDEWRHAFKEYWVNHGGVITADKPANYYTETDFSTQLTAAIATAPDAMLIGGPSATTSLVIEQARSMGYKGGFILIDQAKLDYIARLLKGTKPMGNLIGVAGVSSLPPAEGKPNLFDEAYTKAYKRMTTWECALNYTAMHALSRAIVSAGTVDDVFRIRAAFPKVFPLLADRFPTEAFGINSAGRMLILASVQTVTDGKLNRAELYAPWPTSQREFDQLKKTSKTDKKIPLSWLKKGK